MPWYLSLTLHHLVLGVTDLLAVQANYSVTYCHHSTIQVSTSVTKITTKVSTSEVEREFLLPFKVFGRVIHIRCFVVAVAIDLDVGHCFNEFMSVRVKRFINRVLPV
jgi:hypothetical protein